MTNAHTVNIVEKAFGKGKIVYGIKDIGLSYPVITNKTIDFRTEFKISLTVIFKIGKRQFLKVHNQRVTSLAISIKNIALCAKLKKEIVPAL
jgi:hypothetical protein